MRLSGAGVGGRGAVAAEHRPGPPAGQAHEVRLAAALGEPGVGEGVAELVRVQVGEAGLGPAGVQQVRPRPARNASAWRMLSR